MVINRKIAEKKRAGERAYGTNETKEKKKQQRERKKKTNLFSNSTQRWSVAYHLCAERRQCCSSALKFHLKFRFCSKIDRVSGKMPSNCDDDVATQPMTAHAPKLSSRYCPHHFAHLQSRNWKTVLIKPKTRKRHHCHSANVAQIVGICIARHSIVLELSFLLSISIEAVVYQTIA